MAMMKPTPLTNAGLTLVREPMEGAFTMLMPDGWTNRYDLQREHSLNRIIAVATKPDQTVMIHIGDHRMPMFMEPSPMFDPMLMQFNPHMRMQPYTPAEHFYRDYVQQCFGRSSGFCLFGVKPSPELEEPTVADSRRAGHNARITSAAVTFQHVYNGIPYHCRLHGIVSGIPGVWTTDHFIVSAKDNLEEHCRLGLRMMLSRHFDLRWKQQQQMLHEQRMAMGRQNNQFINQMTQIQAQGHQQRMQDIQSWGAANTRMHEDRMAQMDTSHQSWMNTQQQNDMSHQRWMAQQSQDDAMQQSRINAIREEHTAVDSSGTAYQVDIHHERYFVNKRDNTYIGASATTEQADLRRTHGVNPDDWEEVRVVR